MTIRWSAEAIKDVDRLVDFLDSYDPALADDIEEELRIAPKGLLHFPRRGSRLRRYQPREVREYRVRRYVLRYELKGSDIHILRIFHGREDRI
jgi:plasmid stabilization system protein ParE